MDLQRLGQKGIIIWYGKISISLDILFYTGLSHLAILVECLSWQFCRYCRFWSQAIGSHHLMTIFEHQNDLFSVKLIPQKISLPLCPKLSRDEMFILRQIPTTICNCPKICPQICTSELRRGSQYWKCALFLLCSGQFWGPFSGPFWGPFWGPFFFLRNRAPGNSHPSLPISLLTL